MNEKRTQPAEVTDQLIEAEFQRCGGKWNGDQWVIEDADLHPFARTILALRPQAVPMTEWQPIETAPLAGPFLAVLDCGGDQTICTIRHGVVASKNSRPAGEFIRERVTHWMPLPLLPKSTYTGITSQAKKETP